MSSDEGSPLTSPDIYYDEDGVKQLLLEIEHHILDIEIKLLNNELAELDGLSCSLLEETSYQAFDQSKESACNIIY